MPITKIDKVKRELISWITHLSDVELITFLDGLKNSETERDWWETLNAEQKEVVLAGLEDAKNERMISSSEFWNKLRNGR